MVATSSALRRILHAAAETWRVKPRLSTPDWAAKNVRLPSESTANPGPYDLTLRPWCHEPLAMLDDPDVDEISLMWAAQLGKTKLLQAMMLAVADLEPAPAILCTPDQDSMREFRDGIYQFAELCTPLAPGLPPQHLRNDRYLDFGRMICYLAFSGGKQRLRGRTCKYIFKTEIDVWQDDPRLGATAQLIDARKKAWDEFKIIQESTPTDEASAIARSYERGDKRTYKVPCPHCGHMQELRFFCHKTGPYAGKGGIAGLQDEHGRWLDIEAARLQAYYLCEQGCRIESHEKQDMVLSPHGRWVPAGVSWVWNAAKKKYERSGEAKNTRHRSYHLWSLYAPQFHFGDMAAMYLSARADGKLKEFFTNDLGLPWITTGRMPEWQVLGQRLAGTYPREWIPRDCYFLTVGIDVQGDRVYYVVRGWGMHQRSWLINWGILRRDQGELGVEMVNPNIIAADLKQITPQCIDRSYPIHGGGKNPRGLSQLAARLTGIDTNYRTREVHAFVKSVPNTPERVRAIRGGHSDMAVPYKMSVVEKDAEGKAYPGGLKLHEINVSMFKADLLDRYERPANDIGSWQLPADIMEYGEDYLRQITNESPVIETDKKGRTKVVWKVRDQAVGNHYWDCEVYARALADMVTGNNWDLTRFIPKAAPLPGPPPKEITVR